MFGKRELRLVLDNRFDVKSYVRSADIFSTALNEYARSKEMERQMDGLEER